MEDESFGPPQHGSAFDDENVEEDDNVEVNVGGENSGLTISKPGAEARAQTSVTTTARKGCVSVVVVWGGGAVMDEGTLQLVGNVRLAVLQELQQCTDA